MGTASLSLVSDASLQGHPIDHWIGRFLHSTIKLYNEDCVRGLATLPQESIDVVVTSPPYNLGTNYSRFDDNGPRESYLEWIGETFSLVKSRLRADGSLFLNVGSSPSNPWGPFEIAGILRQKFELQNLIHWVKSIYIENESYGKRSSVNVGHYKPINSPRFLNDTHEFIYHFTKNGDVPIDRLAIGVPYKDSGNTSRWKDGAKGLRCRGNCWYVPYETIQSRQSDRPHPASFPSELAEKCIALHGIAKSRLTVLDPFMGIGSTAIACKRLGVDGVGYEIDPAYFRTSIERLMELG